MADRSLDLKKTFQTISHHMKEEFMVVLSHASHPLEKGLARERVLISFLKKFLPERFGISTGFVIDTTGKCSGQIDIIIYDKIVSPVFALPGDLNYFPAECVVAVGEVKSTIRNKSTLKQAFEKIESVKGLRKFGEKTEFDAGLHSSHGNIGTTIPGPENFPECYQTLGFVFTSDCLSKKTIKKHLTEYFKNTEEYLWPNILIDFEKYLMSYYQNTADSSSLVMFPKDATGFYITKDNEIDNLILLFSSMLFRFLNHARVQSPDLMNYFKITSSNVTEIVFENENN